MILKSALVAAGWRASVMSVPNESGQIESFASPGGASVVAFDNNDDVDDEYRTVVMALTVDPEAECYQLLWSATTRLGADRILAMMRASGVLT